MRNLILIFMFSFVSVSLSANDVNLDVKGKIDCDKLADEVMHDLEHEGGYSSAELIAIRDSVKRNCEKEQQDTPELGYE